VVEPRRIQNVLVAAAAAALCACADAPVAGSVDTGGSADAGGDVSTGGDSGADAADSGGGSDASTDTDAGADADADSDSGADVGADADSDAGSDAGTNTDAGEDAGTDGGETVLRFTALGDTGKGNDAQKAVAAAMKTVCDARGGCAFALLLGDNIYNSGASSVDDPQFQEKFEVPYQDIAFPFHVVLGNHDYGGNGAGFETQKAQVEVDYTAHSQKWSLPAKHYSFTAAPVDFVALDTNAAMFGQDSDQRTDAPAAITAATQPWTIALGHHPYKSNGPHGNAGNYDGLSYLPIVNGAGVESLVEDVLCNKVDVYLCGHDHSLQDLGNVCGVELLVSGGGASTTDLPGSNPTQFQASATGFLLGEATAHTLVFTFFDQSATQLHTRTITRP
jgi:hypothetical protein